jgi:uncharacterized membrane protein YjgN (DUF898 family)
MIPPETPAPSPQSSPSNSAIIAVVLGILSLGGCPVLAPIAWFMGAQELKQIRLGLSPASGELPAKLGMILGIVMTLALLLLTFFVLLFGFGIFVSAFQAIVHS